MLFQDAFKEQKKLPPIKAQQYFRFFFFANEINVWISVLEHETGVNQI
jgi:hypothetical protein